MRQLLTIFAFTLSLLALSCSKQEGVTKKQNSGKKEFSRGLATLENPKLDLVFFIDDSGSMSEEQERLSAELDFFIDQFLDNGVDYRIFIKTMTDTSFHRTKVDYVDRNTPNPIETLKSRIRVGVDGGFEESFFDAADSFLRTNAQDLREDALLTFIFLTDEDEQSEVWQGPEFYRHLLSLKGSHDKVLIFGVFQTPLSNPDRDTDYRRYLPFMEEYGSGYFDINLGSYGQGLLRLSKVVSSYLHYKVALERPPIIGTIRVSLDGQPLDQKFWHYDPLTQTVNVKSEAIEDYQRRNPELENSSFQLKVDYDFI